MATPSTPSSLSLSDIKSTNNIMTGQLNITALAPLRWNLVKAGRTWDSKISTLSAVQSTVKGDLIKSQRQALVSHNKKTKLAFEKAKSAVPMNKRLAMMEKSYENLRFAKQTGAKGEARLAKHISEAYARTLLTLRVTQPEPTLSRSGWIR